MTEKAGYFVSALFTIMFIIDAVMELVGVKEISNQDIHLLCFLGITAILMFVSEDKK